MYTAIVIRPLSIYSKPCECESVQLARDTQGSKFMEESRILIAIREYQQKYAWDKSLTTPSVTSEYTSSVPTPHSNTALEDFVRAAQAQAQQDQG